ncbi:MAG: DUF4089 domain-containing protein [Gammaproteobacteria bacterium]
MTEQDQCVAELVKLFGFDIPKEFREGVAAQLASLLAQAELVTSFPLRDETEPAPVFTP